MVGRLNLHRLCEIAEIFRHRWDPIILGMLAENPSRYRDLARIRDQQGEQIANGVLSGTLRRMVRDGLITKERRADGHTIYRLTPKADSKIERLRRICGTADEPSGDSMTG